MKCLQRSFAVIINPFVTLGLPDNASLDDAKKAYKALVLKYHPDVSKEDHTEKFREITEAYSLAKKRIESRENLAIPKEEGFASKRPKYDGKMGSTIRDDKVREYINFTPLDIKIVDKDRLGINYKPLFDDSDSTHPKTGTMWIMFLCCCVAGTYSWFRYNLKKRDEDLNFLVYEKLQRKYVDTEIQKDTLHPSLQAVSLDPEYKTYLKNTKVMKAVSGYKALIKAPVVLDRFDANLFEKTEEPRIFLHKELKKK